MNTKGCEKPEADSSRPEMQTEKSSSGSAGDDKILDPKVVLVASGMDDEMEELAITLAIEAIAKFPNEKMKIAKYITSRFEAKYGVSWHCIVSDGHMRFYVRYDADNHIYFAVNKMAIFLFRLHIPKSRPLINRLYRRRMSDASVKVDSPRDDVRIISTGMPLQMQHCAIRLSDDAIAQFPNEKMIIAHFITTHFDAQYGGNWHCVVSDGRLGYEVRYDNEDHIFFSVGVLTILLFREEEAQRSLSKPPFARQRKLSASMQLPTKIISTGMDMEMQQLAVTIAAKGIGMKFANEKMQVARLLVRRFEERFGTPWHCIVSQQSFGFYARYDQHNYTYLRVEPLTILLFKHAKKLPSSEDTIDEPNYTDKPDDGGEENMEVQIIASGLEKAMEEKAKFLAVQAITRFSNESMLSAHYIMTRFEAQYGPPWHCIVSDSPLGYGAHEIESYYCYFKLNSTHIFLFQHIVSYDEQ